MQGLGVFTVRTKHTQRVLSYITYRMIRYLGAKSDNLLGDSCSPAFRELLNDVDTESTSPDDREICVSLYLV